MILCALALGLTPFAAPLQDDDRLNAFEAQLDELRVRLKMPGLAVGIVRDGELWWSSGLGFADLETETPVTAETPFHLASLTKTFASTVLMRLVEDGSLDLDTPISEFGGELESPGVITVRHLFSHTSEGTPGESYRYNGNRFGGLDRVIEETTSLPFADIVDELVLTPLQLENTGPQTRSLQRALAQGYQLDPEGAIVRGTYPTFFGVSAGMVSSITDLARFYAATADSSLLDPETQELAFTPTRSTLGHELPYGLGWFTEEYLRKRVYWHYGWWTCISSLVVMVPESGLTFLALANTDHLSRNFQLGVGSGSLLGSPFALAFLREFVYADAEQPWPDIDWNAPSTELMTRLDSARSPTLRSLLERELWANLSTFRTVGNSVETERLLELYGQATRLEALAQVEGRTEIARIDGVGRDRDESSEFICAADSSVRIVAVGELGAEAWSDHGWIENKDGEVVWRMSAESSTHAGGGSSNRACTGRVDLAAGTYRLRYKTDGDHDYEGWGQRPPDGLFWGIALFEE